jgi:hypothetical protein
MKNPIVLSIIMAALAGCYHIVYTQPTTDAASVTDAVTPTNPDSGRVDMPLPADGVDAAIAEDVQTTVAEDSAVAEASTCLSEDIPYDGLDNDCNGWVDDDQRLHADNAWACIADRGCFWFCEPIAHDPWATSIDATGFRGCCTSGRFLAATEVHPGMIVKGSGLPISYIGMDNRRHYFASTSELASWFLQPGGMMNIRRDAQSCWNVVEVSDVVLSSIANGNNAPFRPGSVITGITSYWHRYVVSHGSILHPIIPTAAIPPLAPSWGGDRLALLPDPAYVHYAIGVCYGDPPCQPLTEYDPAAEYETTIDRELGLTP